VLRSSADLKPFQWFTSAATIAVVRRFHQSNLDYSGLEVVSLG
jgi:hypothetical protein